jgi:hypothetical protein
MSGGIKSGDFKPVAIVPAYDAIDVSQLNAISLGGGWKNSYVIVKYPGYWRQQLVHIAGHMKNYTQANKEFQQKVAAHKIGKAKDLQETQTFHIQVLDAFVDVYDDSKVVTVTMDFELISKGTQSYAEQIVKPRYMDAATKQTEIGKQQRSDRLKRDVLFREKDMKQRQRQAVTAFVRSDSVNDINEDEGLQCQIF